MRSSPQQMAAAKREDMPTTPRIAVIEIAVDGGDAGPDGALLDEVAGTSEVLSDWFERRRTMAEGFGFRKANMRIGSSQMAASLQATQCCSWLLVDPHPPMRIEYHRTLLADRVRNAAFHAALQRVIVQGETTVADIGAGTGFLGFLAAKLGAKRVDLYETAEIAAVARKLLSHNRLANCRIAQVHSTDVAEPEPCRRRRLARRSATIPSKRTSSPPSTMRASGSSSPAASSFPPPSSSSSAR